MSPGIVLGIVALLYKSRWDVEKVFDEEPIYRKNGIRNEVETHRKPRTLVIRDQNSKSKNKRCHLLTDLPKAVQRITQRTVMLIRGLKSSEYEAHPGPSLGASRQDLCNLMRPMLDTVN